MAKFQWNEDNTLFDSLSTDYAPAIAHKIYKSYAFSFGYGSPTQPFSGSAMYFISSKQGDSSKIYFINSLNKGKYKCRF